MRGRDVERLGGCRQLFFGPLQRFRLAFQALYGMVHGQRWNSGIRSSNSNPRDIAGQ
jgi:hypothetical protein